MSEGKDEKIMTLRVKALGGDVLSAYWRVPILPKFHAIHRKLDTGQNNAPCILEYFGGIDS